MPKKIGNVGITYLKPSERATYSDGSVEDELLAIFKSSKPQEKRMDILARNPSWPQIYHLSPQRGTLVDWINFDQGASVLEVGAGCGAITESLAKKDIELTALELTEKRALVNAYRNKACGNLSVIVGNLEDLPSNCKFNYIVCVGVLEYAGTFIDDPNPYDAFVKKLQSHLKKDGTLILAIENRLGLKYWAGAREDHTSGFFDSLNQYTHPKKVQTFGKQELADLMRSNGFGAVSFFYPFPDYKHPSAIYSETLIPSHDSFNFPLFTLPTPVPDQTRTWLFSEGLAMRSIERNGLFSEFSNSFLIFASSKEASALQQPLFYISNKARGSLYGIETSILKDNGQLIVQKTAINKNAIAHVDSLQTNKVTLEKIYRESELCIAPVKENASGIATFPFIKGRSLDRIIFDFILADNADKAIQHIKTFIGFIDLIPGAKPAPRFKDVFSEANWPASTTYIAPAIIDFNFDNFIVDSRKKWHLIDYEWVFDFSIPRDFLIARSLIIFSQRYSGMLRYHGNRIELVELAPGIIIPKIIYREFKRYFLLTEKVLKMEKSFQKYVLGKEISASTIKLYDTPRSIYPSVAPVDEYLRIPAMHEDFENAVSEINKLAANVNRLQQENDRLRNKWKNRYLYIPRRLYRFLRKLLRKFKG